MTPEFQIPRSLLDLVRRRAESESRPQNSAGAYALRADVASDRGGCVQIVPTPTPAIAGGADGYQR